MTREEAISIITKERDEDIFGGWTPHRKRIHEAFTLAIEALKREPSEDLISRTDATDLLKRRLYETAMNNDRVPVMDAGDLYADIAENRIGLWMSELPSADRPRGEWHKTENDEMEITGYYCSVCDTPTDEQTHFCPNCGADMRGEDGYSLRAREGRSDQNDDV